MSHLKRRSSVSLGINHKEERIKEIVGRIGIMKTQWLEKTIQTQEMQVQFEEEMQSLIYFISISILFFSSISEFYLFDFVCNSSH